MSDALQARKPGRPDREGRTTIAAWVTQDSAFVFQELLLKLSRERRSKLTMQEAVTEALNDYARKHGITTSLS